MSPGPEAANPESDAWLGRILEESPLLPERRLVQAWLRLLPSLPPSLRYELAAIPREHAVPRGGQRRVHRVAARAAPARTDLAGVAPRQIALGAWSRWQFAAGPWARWGLCLPLVGPGLAELPAPPPPRSPRAATRIASVVADDLQERGPALVVLDLSPTLGTQVAAKLSRAGLARTLVYLPRWPYRQAILPAEELVATLVAESRRLGAATGASAAMVLDGERAQTPGPAGHADPRVDNRHQMDWSDLPDPPALRSEAVPRVLDLREQGTDPPTDFTALAYPRYRRAGLVVSHLRV